MRCDAPSPIAGAPARSHTECMLLTAAWVLFGIEILFALFFSFVFWHFWSHAAMTRATALRATAIYASGCILILLMMLFLPL